MNWINLRVHYKSIVSLILFFSALLIPMIIFMGPLASWMSSFASEEVAVIPSKIYFFFFTLLNLPLVFKILTRQPNTYLVNGIYTLLFLSLSAGLVYVNPLGVFDTPYTLQWIGGLTFVMFAILRYFTDGALREVLLILSTSTLGVCGVNIWAYYPSFTPYYMIGYMIGYLRNMITVDFSIFFSWIAMMIISIPSYLISLIKRVRGSRASTSVSVSVPSVKSNPIPYGVILAEIVLITLYFYVRSWMKGSYGGELLVHNPRELNKTASYKIPDHDEYNYTLTFWLYFDSVSPGFSQSASEFTDVVLYGGNVLIAYNAALNTLRVIMKNKDRKHKYDIVNVPLQKWNQVGLLYANGTFDIFMNGELQKSIVAVPQASNHEVLVGVEKGVHGQLCTLMFYNKVLTMDQLHGLYTQFRDKNPPTV